MAFFRFLAIVFLVIALLLLGGDVLASLDKGDLVMRGLTEDLSLIGANPTDWLERTLPGGAAGVIETVLSWPGWATIGVLGLIIGALSLGPSEREDPDRMHDTSMRE